jgi:hypothetical protein
MAGQASYSAEIKLFHLLIN